MVCGPPESRVGHALEGQKQAFVQAFASHGQGVLMLVVQRLVSVLRLLVVLKLVVLRRVWLRLVWLAVLRLAVLKLAVLRLAVLTLAVLMQAAQDRAVLMLVGLIPIGQKMPQTKAGEGSPWQIQACRRLLVQPLLTMAAGLGVNSGAGPLSHTALNEAAPMTLSVDHMAMLYFQTRLSPCHGVQLVVVDLAECLRQSVAIQA